MGAMQRRKGRKIEQEIVNRHKIAGIHAERVPLSGASHYQGRSHDIDIYRYGRDAPYCCEVKSRKAFPAWLMDWLGCNDVLFLRADRQEPIVVLPWRIWEELLK